MARLNRTTLQNPLNLLLIVSGVGLGVVAAQWLEYQGLGYMEAAKVLVVICSFASLAFLACTTVALRNQVIRYSVLAACGVAVAPLLVQWTLQRIGTELHLSGYAIWGFFLFAFSAELAAVALLIGAAVRAVVRSVKRNRPEI
jgi:hypothetical protein